MEMSGAYQLAFEKAAKINTNEKHNITGKRKVWTLFPGDRVLVQNI